MRVHILLLLALCGVAVRGQASAATTIPSTGATSLLGGQLGGLLDALGQAAASKVTEGVNKKLSAAGPVATSVSEVASTMASQYAALSDSLDEIWNAYDTEYCRPAQFTPGTKKPATFTGHGFSLTFDTGSCYFNDTAYPRTSVKELNCTEPSITYISSPANFTSAYHAAPVFSSKWCQVSKAMGEPLDKVLFEFDLDGTPGKDVLDLDSLLQTIQAEVQKVVGSFGAGSSSFSTMFAGLKMNGTASSSAAAA